MGRNRDNSPVPHTCPKINEVINFIKSIHWDLEDEDEAYFDNEGKLILDVLEEIRSANDSLRTWGNELYQEKDDLEDERDDLNRIIEGLQSDISDLKDENDNLSDENASLMEQINQYN